MTVLDELRSGVHGLRAELPAGLTEQGAGAYDDEANGVRWWVMLEPECAMDLRVASRDHLRRHLERHARAIFISTFHIVNAERPDLRPRTDATDWSPLIEVEHFELDGAPALWTLHRMLYQPGREMLLGHLLVPLEGRLFELRVGAHENTTALQDTSKAVTDPARYVDSRTIPYVVLPSKPDLGARLGDIALVVNKSTARRAFAIYADVGPVGHIGEGSIALAEALGVEGSPRTGGAENGVVYLVFPGSGAGRPLSPAEIVARGEAALAAWGPEFVPCLQ